MSLSAILIIIIVILAFVLIVMGSVMFFLLKRTIKAGMRLAFLGAMLIGVLLLGGVGAYLFFNSASTKNEKPKPTRPR